MIMRKSLSVLLLSFFVIAGCSKDESKPSFKISNNNIVLTHTKTEALKITGAESSIVYSSDNKYIVYYGRDREEILIDEYKN